MSSIKTPHAAIVVWNYKDRLGAEDSYDNEIHNVEKKIFNTVSCISIKTAKSKSQPQGSFEIRLAPTKNWVTALSAGSWLCILMSQQKIEYKDIAHKADPNKVKMLGRIESVRAHVTVNQQTGARQTEYVVQGSDWGSVFNTVIYVDPLMRDVGEGSFWATWKILYEKHATSVAENGLKTPSEIMRALLDLWGTEKESVTSEIDDILNKHYSENNVNKDVGDGPMCYLKEGSGSSSVDNVTVKATTTLKLPTDVARYFGFSETALSSLIKIGSGYEGVVESTGNKYIDEENGSTIYYDRYNNSKIDAIGFIQPNSVFGVHTVWQLLNDNCNNILNELIPEIRWTPSGKAELVLYRRIRPFVFRDDFEGINDVKDFAARMSDVRTVSIPKDEILAVDVGTNWRDKINFVEIMPDQSLTREDFVIPHAMKLSAQTYDENAFSREGFRPLMKTTKYLAPDDKLGFDYMKTSKWKNLLREWHFNSHLLLNGNIVFIGQNNYIQVGDNILFDESIITTSNNTNIDSLKSRDRAPQILAHVEAVSHNFTVNEDGSRSFTTTISFIRGMVVGQDRLPLNTRSAVFEEAEGRVDKSTQDLPAPDDLNKKDTFGTSTENDPDTDRLRGK